MRNKGPLLVLFCYVLFGILPIYWKLIGNLDPYFILANRVVWSLAFALFCVAIKGQWWRIKALRHEGKLLRTLLVSGALLVVNWGSYIIAVNTDHIIDASLAYYLNPIMSILIGCFFFREQLTGLQKCSVALATLGVLYGVVSFGVVPWLALVIGGTFALYGALKKAVVLDGVTSLAIECLWMLVPALIGYVWLVSQGRFTMDGSAISWWQWLILPTTGIITGWPLVIFARGLRTTSYSLSGILMYINPTLQLLCGVFLYGEHFNAIYGVMFAFVWAAVLLYLASILLEHRRQQRQRDNLRQ
ncbi:MAG: EamA family transporter RarD [Peptococcaceae bacterium]|nr:EamA family transporter RarD [Peptococcaceae bacterium]